MGGISGLNDKTVEVRIDSPDSDVIVTATTQSSGMTKGHFTITVDTSNIDKLKTPGQHEIYLCFGGDSSYKSTNISLTLTIKVPKVATPTANPVAGTYTSAQSVELSTATPEATIYYTTDGTAPTTSSTEYTEAITVNADTTIKAIAVKEDWADSDVLTAAYKINVMDPVELLTAKTSGNKAVKLSWTKVAGATKYVVYGNKCGKSMKKLKTTSGTKFTVKKISGKKLKAHKEYKFKVVAYSGNKKLVASNPIHFITAKTRGKFANATGISVKPLTATRKPGETVILKVKTKIYKNKEHINGHHGIDTKFTSDCPSVATVNKDGQVKAVAPGTATIYIQDIGGKYCKITVTVK